MIASNYRGSPGSEGQEEFGGADVNDVLNLLPLIDSLKDEIDPARIGMPWTGSTPICATENHGQVSSRMADETLQMNEAVRRRIDALFGG